MTELDLVIYALSNIRTYGELAGGQFEALAESLNVGALICNGTAQVLFASKPVLKMLHASAKTVQSLRPTDFLQGRGLNLADRMKFQPSGIESGLVDAFLLDTRGVRQRVAIFIHPLDKPPSDAMRAMIILVPEKKRAALCQALERTGSANDYLSYFLLLAQETERKRIASDLHDGLGQILTMLKFRVEDSVIRLDAGKSDETRSILKEVVVQLREAVGDVRRISTELRPSMLDDLGLLPTVEWLCRQFEAAHTGISVTLDQKIDEESIPIPVKIPMFRLIQEAINNVAKHSNATSVFVYLRVHYDGFLVGVVDNGVGFDAKRLTSGAACLLGVGINSMRERVEASHGVFSIRSHAGSGTAISAVWGSNHEVFRRLIATPKSPNLSISLPSSTVNDVSL